MQTDRHTQPTNCSTCITQWSATNRKYSLLGVGDTMYRVSIEVKDYTVR